jgi:hypothetical protein
VTGMEDPRLEQVFPRSGVPWLRFGELAKATPPDGDASGLRLQGSQAGQQTGVQAIVNWARENGMIPNGLTHSRKMRVDEDDPEGSFEPTELRTLFASRWLDATTCGHAILFPALSDDPERVVRQRPLQREHVNRLLIGSSPYFAGLSH